jgi:hypothetical protein
VVVFVEYSFQSGYGLHVVSSALSFHDTSKQ